MLLMMFIFLCFCGQIIMLFAIMRGQERLQTLLHTDIMRLEGTLLQVQEQLTALAGGEGVGVRSGTASVSGAENRMHEPQAAATAAASVAAEPDLAYGTCIGDTVFSTSVYTPEMDLAPDAVGGQSMQDSCASEPQRYAVSAETAPSAAEMGLLSMTPPAPAGRQPSSRGAGLGAQDRSLDLHFDHLTPPRR